MPTIYNEKLKLHYDIKGQGPAVVFIAGMGGCGDYWAPQVKRFSSDFTCIIYDQAGAGKSQRDTGPRSVRQMGNDILAILEAEGISKAHMVGHAIGAFIALEAAQIAPSRVLSINFVNSWLACDSHIRRCFEIRKSILHASGRKAYLTAQPLFLYPATWLSSNETQIEAAIAHGLDTMPSSADLVSRIDTFLSYDATAACAALKMPVLVTASKDDMLVPWHMSEQLARQIPNARLQVVDWGGHAFSRSAQQSFDFLLEDFLNQCTPEIAL